MSDRFDFHGEQPFVSVIIPTFDRSRLLKDAISTIYEQDYPKDAYEIIIVDNNSSDDTAATVSRLAEGATVDLIYIKEERPGLVFARHSGATRARGTILVFGDDDGLYEKNWISAIIDVYHKHAQVGAVGTTIDIKWDDAPAPWVKAYEGYLGKLHYGPLPVVKRGLQIFGGSFSIRKAVLYAVKGFNPDQIGNDLIGDGETGLCRKLAAAGIPVGCTPATTMWHVQFRDTHGTFQDLKRRLRNNGVVQAYDDTFSCGNPLRIGYRTLRHAHKIVRRVLSRLLRSDTNHLGVDALLQINELFYRIKYLFLFRFHPRLRREIIRRDWEFTPDYSVGETRYYARVVATGEPRVGPIHSLTLPMWYMQKSAIDPAAIRVQLSRLLNITAADTPTSEFQETGASGAVHKVTLRDGKNRPHRVILKLVSNASPYLLYKEILEPLDLDSPMMFGCIDTGKGLYLVMEYIPHEPLTWTTQSKYERALNWLVKKDTLIQDSVPRLQQSQYLQRFAARPGYMRVEYCVETITKAIKSLLTPSLSGKLLDTLTYYQADLHRLQTRLSQTCRLTLSHYDFQMANILFGIEEKKGKTYIIDWSDPCIDSVCIDLVTLLSNAPIAIRQSLLEMYRTQIDFPNFDEIYHGAEVLINIALLAWMVDMVLDGQTNMVHLSGLERQAERIQHDLSGLDQILA